MAMCALTTFDNPYNPFDNFFQWFLYDVSNGYNTCGYLARVCEITDDMTESEKDFETERAIDQIINNDFLNIYKKVSVSDPPAAATG